MAEEIPQPTPKPPAASPEVLAQIELANRRFELLERRIAAWERRLAELEDALGAEQAPAEQPGLERLDDLEARITRLERKRIEQLARGGGAATAARAPAAPLAPPVEVGDARALVFARWEPLKSAPGEAVTLHVMVDGFEPEATVRFVIRELEQPDAEPIVLEAKAGEGDRAEVRWTPPKPTGKRKTREFTFKASCEGHDAQAPVLTVGE